MARQRQGKRQQTFLELNVALAAAALHGDKPISRWSAAKALAGSISTASRVGEFIAMWAIAKHKLGEDVTTERVAAYWKMNERTAYRRLDEFRSVWGPPGLTRQLETPDEIADSLIAQYKQRQQKLERSALADTAGLVVDLPDGLLGTG
jgi:hypothetical protein